MKRYINFIIMVGMATLFAVSCEHKDLCLQHPHRSELRIQFDWRNCPDAKNVVKDMNVYFYPIDRVGSCIHYQLGKSGGVVSLQDGLYHVICYNESATVRGGGVHRFETHYGYTRKAGILESVAGVNATTTVRAEGTEDQRVVLTPDGLWGCNVYDMKVEGGQIDYFCYPEQDSPELEEMHSVGRVITLYPSDLLCHYSYEVLTVVNAKYITDVCCALSGMSGHYYFANDTVGSEPVQLPTATKFEKYGDDNNFARFSGEFFTFGHHENNEFAHKMMFYIWRTNDAATREVDVTAQVDTAPNPRRVHIIIDTIKLNPAIDPDSGFDVVIDDWVDVDIDIPL